MEATFHQIPHTIDVLGDNTERECLTHHSKHYILVEGKLYHKNAKGKLLQKCVSMEEGEMIRKEIHAGTCSNHAASRTLVSKAFQAGFYWPSAVADAEAFVRRCENCQFFAKQIHVPAQALQKISASRPFACWGLDMIRPFKPTPRGFCWVYVCIDKFSMWIKYKPLVQATTKKAAELLDDIIHWFSLLNIIITDLGSTFTSPDF